MLIGVIITAFAFQMVAAKPSAALAGLSASLTLGLRQASRERSPGACR
jgi:hypothetical protein